MTKNHNTDMLEHNVSVAADRRRPVSSRMITGCLACIMASAAIGFLFYRFLCDFHAPVSSVETLLCEPYVLLTESPDGELICTIRNHEDADYVSMRLLIESDGYSFLSDPLSGKLTLKASEALDIPVEFTRCMLTRNDPGADPAGKIQIESLAALLPSDAVGRIVFSDFGKYLTESEPFYILPWLQEASLWK